MENVNFYVVYVIQFPRGWSWILENLLRYFIISFIFFLGKIRLKNYYLFIKIKITQLKHYSHKNSQAKLDILLCHIIVHEKLKTLHHTYIYIYATTKFKKISNSTVKASKKKRKTTSTNI